MKLPWIQRASFYIYSCEAALLNQFGICYSTSKQVNCKWSCVSIALFPVHSALKVLCNTCHIHPFKHTFIHWWKRKKKNGEKPVSRQRLSSFVMFVYNPHVWRCEVPLEFSASFQGLFCLKKNNNICGLSQSNSWPEASCTEAKLKPFHFKYLTLGILQ